MAFTWHIVSDFEVEQIVNGNQITLCVDDEKAIDSTFILQVVVDEVVQNEMEILVRGEI